MPGIYEEVIVGHVGAERNLLLARSTLERIPVFRDWFENPDTRDLNLLRGTAFYFPHFEPDAFEKLVEILEGRVNTNHVSLGCAVTMTKTCLTLGLHDIVQLLFSRIQNTAIHPADFFEIAIYADGSGLSENTKFKSWMINYMSNLNGPTLYQALEEVNRRGTHEPVKVLHVLTSTIRHLNDELQKAKKPAKGLLTPSGSPPSKGST